MGVGDLHAEGFEHLSLLIAQKHGGSAHRSAAVVEHCDLGAARLWQYQDDAVGAAVCLHLDAAQGHTAQASASTGAEGGVASGGEAVGSGAQAQEFKATVLVAGDLSVLTSEQAVRAGASFQSQGNALGSCGAPVGSLHTARNTAQGQFEVQLEFGHLAWNVPGVLDSGLLANAAGNLLHIDHIDAPAAEFHFIGAIFRHRSHLQALVEPLAFGIETHERAPIGLARKRNATIHADRIVLGLAEFHIGLFAFDNRGLAHLHAFHQSAHVQFPALGGCAKPARQVHGHHLPCSGSHRIHLEGPIWAGKSRAVRHLGHLVGGDQATAGRFPGGVHDQAL